MPIKLSGTLSIEDIVNEFGGTPPYSLSQYYRQNGLVPNGPPENNSIPLSGTISYSNFYGARRSFSTCYETSAPLSATRVRTIPWDNSISHTVTLDFGTQAAADEYFRREGAVIWNGSLALNGGSDAFIAPGWRDFLAIIPNVTITANTTTQGATTVSLGWATLTSTPQPVFFAVASTYYTYYQSAATVTINASKVGSVLTLTAILTEGLVNNTGSVIGNVTSMFTLRRASTACIDPAIPYPSAVSSGSM